MINVCDVHRRFGPVHAVRGVSLEAARGEAVGLLGPNGAGKTTTMRMITGALPPTAGCIRVDGLDTLTDSLAARRRIGYLPESTPIYPEMRVEDFLGFRATLHRLARRDRRQAVSAAIERCWLEEVRRRRVGDLSKGYRQRVGLAAALLHEPPALILDEPTSGLDPAQIAETRRLIRELAQGRAVILSSHILAEVEKTCDRVVIIMQGRVRASGAVRDLAGGAERCVVEAQAPSEEVVRRVVSAGAGLRTASIAQVEAGATLWWRVVVEPASESGDCGAAGGDLRERAACAFRDANLLVREIRREVDTLEERFLDLLRGEASEADESGAVDAPQRVAAAAAAEAQETAWV